MTSPQSSLSAMTVKLAKAWSLQISPSLPWHPHLYKSQMTDDESDRAGWVKRSICISARDGVGKK